MTMMKLKAETRYSLKEKMENKRLERYELYKRNKILHPAVIPERSGESGSQESSLFLASLGEEKTMISGYNPPASAS